MGRIDLSVDDDIAPGDSEVCITMDTGAGDSSSDTGKEEDWDRMDSASDLDAVANTLQVAVDGGGTVRGSGVSQKLSKNRHTSRTRTFCLCVHRLCRNARSAGRKLHFSNSRDRLREFWRSSSACEAVEVDRC